VVATVVGGGVPRQLIDNMPAVSQQIPGACDAVNDTRACTVVWRYTAGCWRISVGILARDDRSDR